MLRSLLNCMPCMLRMCSHASMPCMLTFLCANVSYVLTSLVCLYAHMPTCLVYLHAHVPMCLACSHANVPCVFVGFPEGLTTLSLSGVARNQTGN